MLLIKKDTCAVAKCFIHLT